MVAIRGRLEAADCGNRVLSAVPAAERNLIQPHLEHVSLPQETVLWEPGRKAERIYFPYRGAVSLIAQMADGRTIGLSMIGADGVVGCLVAIGLQQVSARCVVHVELGAFSMSVGRLQEILPQTAALKTMLAADADRLLFQMQQISACNALHPAEMRLARLLLRAADCIGDRSGIPLTQEQMSQMLGVQRTSVNLIIRIMATDGILRSGRGRVEIVDRGGLEQRACECYASISERLHQSHTPQADHSAHC
jgi:CRP-like cAMP-binding protein